MFLMRDFSMIVSGRFQNRIILLYSTSKMLCYVQSHKTILPSTSGMKNREERSKHFFDSGPLMEEDEGIALHDRVRRISNE